MTNAERQMRCDEFMQPEAEAHGCSCEVVEDIPSGCKVAQIGFDQGQDEIIEHEDETGAEA